MKTLLEQIKAALVDFVTWFSPELKPPRKSWCAVFYFVAQEDAGMSYPDTGLDVKLEEIIGVLQSTPFDTDKIHVVYRAIWADWNRPPVASVLGSSKLCPDTDYPLGCKDKSTPVTTGTDLPCFLEWVFDCCPADHYAIFFWGHSFGPAGLFEPGGPIKIPRRTTGLERLRTAFEQFLALRAADSPRGAPPAVPQRAAGSAAPIPSGPPSIDDAAAMEALEDLEAADPRVEVVLFQDCWMSTLETAYELRDVVQYVIGSQSLLPIGTGHPDFVWPYEQLLNDLLAADFQVQMTHHVIGFYDSHLSKIPTTLATVPISLLDLSGAAGITQPLNGLVQSLNNALSLEERWLLIRQGRIPEPFALDANGVPTAGDAALMDVRRMCERMGTHPDPGISSAAISVLATLDALIQVTGESLGTAANPLGFGGISVLYSPPSDQQLDKYITQVLDTAFYMSLRFSKETSWPAIEQP